MSAAVAVVAGDDPRDPSAEVKLTLPETWQGDSVGESRVLLIVLFDQDADTVARSQTRSPLPVRGGMTAVRLDVAVTDKERGLSDVHFWDDYGHS